MFKELFNLSKKVKLHHIPKANVVFSKYKYSMSFNQPTWLQSSAVTDHTFDAVVVGAGASGLRAASSLSALGYSVACISKVFPTKSNSVSNQNGINAALSQVQADNWKWHVFDTIKGGDWLGDQNAINFMCRSAPQMIRELQSDGVEFKKTDQGKLDQRKLGGHSINYGFGDVAHRSVYANSSETGHSLVHNLLEKALDGESNFFVEYFALDLLLDEADQSCQGILAMSLADGSFHRFKANNTILATGGFTQVYSNASTSRSCTGDGGAMVSRAGLPLQDLEFVQFNPTGLKNTDIILSEAIRAEGAVLRNKQGDPFMEKYAPQMKDLAPQDVITKAIISEISAGRGCGPEGNHVLLDLRNINKKAMDKRIKSVGKIYSGVDVEKEPLPIVPLVHYNMGGIPTNYRTEVIRKNENGQDVVVKGLLAIGEASCSVHGANHLAGNNLTEELVFGKMAAVVTAQNYKPRAPQKSLSKNAGVDSLERVKQLRASKGDVSIKELKDRLQKTMDKYVGLMRDESSLQKACSELDSISDAFKFINLSTSGSQWNNELSEALELENMIILAKQAAASALNRKESRGFHLRKDFEARNDEEYLSHSLSWLQSPEGKVSISSRPVSLSSEDDDYFLAQPAKRTY